MLRRKRDRSVALLAVSCATFALLIWMKLRVVAGVPRTAYAEPELRQPASPPSPGH